MENTALKVAARYLRASSKAEKQRELELKDMVGFLRAVKEGATYKPSTGSEASFWKKAEEDHLIRYSKGTNDWSLTVDGDLYLRKHGK